MLHLMQLNVESSFSFSLQIEKGSTTETSGGLYSSAFRLLFHLLRTNPANASLKRSTLPHRTGREVDFSARSAANGLQLPITHRFCWRQQGPRNWQFGLALSDSRFFWHRTDFRLANSSSSKR